MLGLSLPEILFLSVLALVVIGPKQLPEVARTLGRLINELRRASNSFTNEIRQHVRVDPIRFEDPPPSTPPENPELTPAEVHTEIHTVTPVAEASPEVKDVPETKDSEVKKS